MVMDLSPGRVSRRASRCVRARDADHVREGGLGARARLCPPEDDRGRDALAPGRSTPDDAPGPTWTTPQVVLVLTTLDPGIGAGHLRSSRRRGVVVVTAGRSSATEVRATAEMIRAAGLVRERWHPRRRRSKRRKLWVIQGLRGGQGVPDGIDDLMETPFVVRRALPSTTDPVPSSTMASQASPRPIATWLPPSRSHRARTRRPLDPSPDRRHLGAAVLQRDVLRQPGDGHPYPVDRRKAPDPGALWLWRSSWRSR